MKLAANRPLMFYVKHMSRIPLTHEEADGLGRYARANDADCQSGIDNRLPPHPDHNTQNSKSDNLNGWENSTNRITYNERGPVIDWIDEHNEEQHNGWELPQQNPDHNIRFIKPDNLSGWLSSSNNTTHNDWGPASESSPPKPSDKIDKPDRFQTNFVSAHPQSSEGVNERSKEMYYGWGVPVPKPIKHNTEVTYMTQSQYVPWAPPFPTDGLDASVVIQYPSIDLRRVESSVPCLENEKVGTKIKVKDQYGSSFCAIIGKLQLRGHVATWLVVWLVWMRLKPRMGIVLSAKPRSVKSSDYMLSEM